MAKSNADGETTAAIVQKVRDGIEELDDKIVGSDVLLTGFPGFLGEHVLERLIELQPESTFYLLIQSQMRGLAERYLDKLERENPHFEGRWELLEGDITDRFLGLDEERYHELTATVGVVWHLAAIYDLAVPEQIAYRVNVTGTIHVLDFCEACESLQRFNYISTCYVSGEREGKIYEDELDEGQGHKNHYESTKFWAEVEVQRRSKEIPTAIFRPGIVVGDSRTGETFKYDGPYYLMKLLRRLPDWMPMVNIGKGETVVNLVPIDFVADAMAFLGNKEGVEGQIFQLADPNPMRARDVVALTLDSMNKAPALATVPSSLLDVALSRQKVEELVGVPRESIVYFNHDARYDSSNTQRELKETAIRCPHLSTYMQTLVDYFLRNPEKEFLDKRRI
ncbi:SDR family oxidoreductase [Persicimonas caeni]|uniref:SDR family oxidoreductase n=1 Tax=Persicimonas caeni TaxID=2292766 RepID=A0A4Y6PXC3_PERCE|nr:SDR family oxidoreductase [Persicimonas caeni]QDG52984.1 SDR family oxidoreductase [Persicimonas caeni]QED34206.1 SDR family oxidoreductase [Persicimonas caeni]